MTLLHTTIKPVFKNWRKVDPKESPEYVATQVDNATHHAAQFLAHSFFTIYGFIVMYDKYWTPWYLGGSGSVKAGFADFPMTTLDQ